MGKNINDLKAVNQGFIKQLSDITKECDERISQFDVKVQTAVEACILKRVEEAVDEVNTAREDDIERMQQTVDSYAGDFNGVKSTEPTQQAHAHSQCLRPTPAEWLPRCEGRGVWRGHVDAEAEASGERNVRQVLRALARASANGNAG